MWVPAILHARDERAGWLLRWAQVHADGGGCVFGRAEAAYFALHSRSSACSRWGRACYGSRRRSRSSMEFRLSARCTAGMGETRVPMFANLVGYWVLGLPLGFISALYLSGESTVCGSASRWHSSLFHHPSFATGRKDSIAVCAYALNYIELMSDSSLIWFKIQKE